MVTEWRSHSTSDKTNTTEAPRTSDKKTKEARRIWSTDSTERSVTASGDATEAPPKDDAGRTSSRVRAAAINQISYWV